MDYILVLAFLLLAEGCFSLITGYRKFVSRMDKYYNDFNFGGFPVPKTRSGLPIFLIAIGLLSVISAVVLVIVSQGRALHEAALLRHP